MTCPDATAANRAELAALDHDEPHLIGGDCRCACRVCTAGWSTCACPDCACREDDPDA